MKDLKTTEREIIELALQVLETENYQNRNEEDISIRKLRGDLLTRQLEELRLRLCEPFDNSQEYVFSSINKIQILIYAHNQLCDKTDCNYEKIEQLWGDAEYKKLSYLKQSKREKEVMALYPSYASEIKEIGKRIEELQDQFLRRFEEELYNTAPFLGEWEMEQIYRALYMDRVWDNQYCYLEESPTNIDIVTISSQEEFVNLCNKAQALRHITGTEICKDSVNIDQPTVYVLGNNIVNRYIKHIKGKAVYRGTYKIVAYNPQTVPLTANNVCSYIMERKFKIRRKDEYNRKAGLTTLGLKI